MIDHTIDLSPLERVINRLSEGWIRYQIATTELQIRDGLIQRFEFTYEICHKTLKRYLEFTSTSPTQYDAMSFADLIRSGNVQGLLLGTWPDWKRYRDMRAKTSHSYDEGIAFDLVAGIPAFLADAQHLFAHLKARRT